MHTRLLIFVLFYISWSMATSFDSIEDYTIMSPAAIRDSMCTPCGKVVSSEYDPERCCKQRGVINADGVCDCTKRSCRFKKDCLPDYNGLPETNIIRNAECIQGVCSALKCGKCNEKAINGVCCDSGKLHSDGICRCECYFGTDCPDDAYCYHSWCYTKRAGKTCGACNQKPINERCCTGINSAQSDVCQCYTGPECRDGRDCKDKFSCCSDNKCYYKQGYTDHYCPTGLHRI